MLVTGASRGIGRSLVHFLSQQGATVIAIARTSGALEELDDQVRQSGHPPLVLVNEDLRKTEKIDHIAAALYERFGRLDALVGNAALLGTLGPVGHIKPKVRDDIMDTNVRVNWDLIRYMEPLLKKSDSGRAVFITSSVARKPRAYWGPYAASKAALEALVLSWSQELEKTSVHVNLYDPGATRTRMRAHAFPGEDPQTLPSPDIHAAPIAKLLTADCRDHGQSCLLYTSPSPRDKRQSRMPSSA